MNALFLIGAIIVACSAAVHFSYYLEFDGPTWEDTVSRVTALVFFLLECGVAVALLVDVFKGGF